MYYLQIKYTREIYYLQIVTACENRKVTKFFTICDIIIIVEFDIAVQFVSNINIW